MAKFPSDILLNIGGGIEPQRQVQNPEDTKKELYRAKLSISDAGDGSVIGEFETWLDESFQIGVTAGWDNPFSASLTEQLAGSGSIGQVLQGAERLVGITTKFKKATGGVWTNSSPITISLPFKFKAKTDPVSEVIVPAKKLMQFAAPDEVDGRLKPPGPILGDQVGLVGALREAGIDLDQGEHIKVKIGKFLVFEPVVITSVTHEIGTQFDYNGNPLSITVNVECQTFFVATRPDLEKSFVTG
jgi:hypothetical protein